MVNCVNIHLHPSHPSHHTNWTRNRHANHLHQVSMTCTHKSTLLQPFSLLTEGRVTMLSTSWNMTRTRRKSWALMKARWRSLDMSMHEVLWARSYRSSVKRKELGAKLGKAVATAHLGITGAKVGRDWQCLGRGLRRSSCFREPSSAEDVAFWVGRETREMKMVVWRNILLFRVKLIWGYEKLIFEI